MIERGLTSKMTGRMAMDALYALINMNMPIILCEVRVPPTNGHLQESLMSS